MTSLSEPTGPVITVVPRDWRFRLWGLVVAATFPPMRMAWERLTWVALAITAVGLTLTTAAERGSGRPGVGNLMAVLAFAVVAAVAAVVLGNQWWAAGAFVLVALMPWANRIERNYSSVPGLDWPVRPFEIAVSGLALLAGTLCAQWAYRFANGSPGAAVVSVGGAGAGMAVAAAGVFSSWDSRPPIPVWVTVAVLVAGLGLALRGAEALAPLVLGVTCLVGVGFAVVGGWIDRTGPRTEAASYLVVAGLLLAAGAAAAVAAARLRRDVTWWPPADRTPATVSADL